jgi:site-specific DNA-adenine methylase
MNYQGGKFRIAKQIVGAIERERERVIARIL